MGVKSVVEVQGYSITVTVNKLVSKITIEGDSRYETEKFRTSDTLSVGEFTITADTMEELIQKTKGHLDLF